jgi:hypothetical protein
MKVTRTSLPAVTFLIALFLSLPSHGEKRCTDNFTPEAIDSFNYLDELGERSEPEIKLLHSLVDEKLKGMLTPEQFKSMQAAYVDVSIPADQRAARAFEIYKSARLASLTESELAAFNEVYAAKTFEYGPLLTSWYNADDPSYRRGIVVRFPRQFLNTGLAYADLAHEMEHAIKTIRLKGVSPAPPDRLLFDRTKMRRGFLIEAGAMAAEGMLIVTMPESMKAELLALEVNPGDEKLLQIRKMMLVPNVTTIEGYLAAQWGFGRYSKAARRKDAMFGTAGY